jgi:hypothetical protein
MAAAGSRWGALGHDFKGSQGDGHYPLGPMRRLPVLLASLLAAAALAGCAGTQPNASAGDFEGAERDVAQAVDDLKTSRDPEEICSRIFSDELARSLQAGSRDCVDEVQATMRDVASTDLEVRDVSISGTTARAQVRQGGKTATFELARSGTSWQITSLGAS